MVPIEQPATPGPTRQLLGDEHQTTQLKNVVSKTTELNAAVRKLELAPTSRTDEIDLFSAANFDDRKYVDVSAGIVHSSKEAAAQSIGQVLKDLNVKHNYDRIVNVHLFSKHISKSGVPPQDPQQRAIWRNQVRATYAPPLAKDWLQYARGGNCHALSVMMLDRAKGEGIGCVSGALIGSNLKQRFNISLGGTGLAATHVGCLIGVRVKGEHRPVEFIADPGFNATEVFELPTSYTSQMVALNHETKWVIQRDQATSTTSHEGLRVRQAEPLDLELDAIESPLDSDANKSKLAQAEAIRHPFKYATFSLRPNQENSLNMLTQQLAPVDTRPMLLAKDVMGTVSANVTIEFKRPKEPGQPSFFLSYSARGSDRIQIPESQISSLSTESFADIPGMKSKEFLDHFQGSAQTIVDEIKEIYGQKDLLMEFQEEVRPGRDAYLRESKKKGDKFKAQQQPSGKPPPGVKISDKKTPDPLKS